ITATDTVTSITGSQTGIIVNSAAATTLTMTAPTTASAGIPISVVVTAKDAFTNTATGYLGTVQFTTNDPGSLAAPTLPADYPFVAGDNGTHTFSATLKTPGAWNITAKDTVTSTITGTTANITVSPGPVTTYTITGYASPATAGVAQAAVVVVAKDAIGNVATNYRGTIHFTSSDSQATLPSDYAYKNPDSGSKTFSVTLKTAGTQSITATDTGTPTATGSQSGIVINLATLNKLGVVGFPSPTT